MTYADLLKESAEEAGNIICMGLDPVVEAIPTGNFDIQIEKNIIHFFRSIFDRMADEGKRPAAFKPNMAFYESLDEPRQFNFYGSNALATVLDMINSRFPGVPVISDCKRGDIGKTSAAYAEAILKKWGFDACTAHSYMGTDSVSPFFLEDKGVYLLARTSNPGAEDFQSLPAAGMPLYQRVGQKIIEWAEQYSGIGAVVGATSPRELGKLTNRFSPHNIPLLIPGVGGQGGSGDQVMETLRIVEYDKRLVRVNSSSGLTRPWHKDGRTSDDWLGEVMESYSKLEEELRI